MGGGAWWKDSHREHARSCLLRSRGVSPPRGTFHKNPLLLEAKLTLLANESLVRVVGRSVVL